MQADGMKYRAVRDIAYNNVVAYSAGQLVHETAVDGPAAWLRLGEDVEPVEGAVIPAPARDASQGAWAAFMISRGLDADTAAGMSRAQLIDAYDQSEVTAPAAKGRAAPKAAAGG